MSVLGNLGEEIKAAMKARDALRLETLRAIKKELLEARTAKNAGGEVSEENEIKLLQKMVKQRRDSADIYNAQGRADLSEKELMEADIIGAYLPKQLTFEELESAVKKIIASENATSMKDMGKVMAAASSQLAGKADGKDISQMVKRLLS
ncbi:GatB/YqeY domain-containing protein [Geofilum rubicundum]|uniref:Transamidase GatB domain protein n=1 Tax=Geofilum rubicundum JCM 15548 TaxID=1236989 RepID=A0A0E9M0T7_9BACT|nr:GatB/YqeY domain-containing protein [Geofilum rubicundum]GAO30986.1 transamidase GatB domain protein [Geofilum rubicundum JCM 15548]